MLASARVSNNRVVRACRIPDRCFELDRRKVVNKMAEIAMLIGGAGTGKTTRLLDIMAKVISRGIDPHELGFVSFTRAARSEAASRAADLFKVSQSDLESKGWFRTLHSVCYRCLGSQRGDLLTGKVADKAWLEDALQEPVSGATGAEDGDSLAEIVCEGNTDADLALKLWGAARSRLVPFRDVWEAAWQIDQRSPALEFCENVIGRYELGKRACGRADFTDLLCKFAGWHCTLAGANKVEPAGDCPELPVWFFDEQQDTSALLDSVCHRLMEKSQWVYVVGDPFQAIYGWAGADPSHFLAWPAQKKDIMRKSFRCPPCVLSLGEEILRGCSDYWDREIEPSDHDGTVDRLSIEQAVGEVDPRESWLLIARTNREAAMTLAARMNRLGIPWKPTRGNGGWAAPVKNAALRALTDLEAGNPIDGDQWRKVLKVLPVKDFLERGIKSKFEDKEYDAAELHPWVMVDDLAELGATPKLVGLIKSGQWAEEIDDGERWREAVKQWGVDAVEALKVNVGTIHSTKGAEADNVLLLTSTTRQVVKGQETQSGFNEERRVEYVAVTRARKRLLIADDPRAPFRMEVPA